MKQLRAVVTSVLAVVVVSLLTLNVGQTSAATSSGNGMRVSPVRTDLTMSPGSSKVVSVYVQNVTDGTENLRVIVNDFVSKTEDGQPSLLLNGEANPDHGLKKYISVPQTVTIPAGQEKVVSVTVNIPKGAAGGAYYGAIRFAPSNGSSDESNDNVSLSGSVGSLILASVPGKVTENLQLASFDARTKSSGARFLFTSGKNIVAVTRFHNFGNALEEPFGKVILKKGNTTLGTYNINTTVPPGNVLPDSIRRFDIPLTKVGNFGKYRLEGNFGYGNKGQLLTASTTFYVIPLPLLILIAIVVIIILFLIFAGPKMVRRYNQRILRNAGRR